MPHGPLRNGMERYGTVHCLKVLWHYALSIKVNCNWHFNPYNLRGYLLCVSLSLSLCNPLSRTIFKLKLNHLSWIRRRLNEFYSEQCKGTSWRSFLIPLRAILKRKVVQLEPVHSWTPFQTAVYVEEVEDLPNIIDSKTKKLSESPPKDKFHQVMQLEPVYGRTV